MEFIRGVKGNQSNKSMLLIYGKNNEGNQQEAVVKSSGEQIPTQVGQFVSRVEHPR